MSQFKKFPTLKEIDLWWDGHDDGRKDANILLVNSSDKVRRDAEDRYNESLKQNERTIWCDGYVRGFRDTLMKAGDEAA